jgi:hypothetical protein
MPWKESNLWMKELSLSDESWMEKRWRSFAESLAYRERLGTKFTSATSSVGLED